MADVLGGVFNRIDEGLRGWVKNLEQADTLTDAHRTALAGMAEGISEDLRARLVDAPAARQQRNETAATDELPN